MGVSGIYLDTSILCQGNRPAGAGRSGHFAVLQASPAPGERVGRYTIRYGSKGGNVPDNAPVSHVFRPSKPEKIMDTAIHLVGDSLYRESIARKLSPGRFRILEYGAAIGDSAIDPDTTCKVNVFILQADLWPGIKHNLSRPAPVIMLGNPFRFHCWIEAVKKRTAAYMTPYDSSATVTESLEAVLMGHHYLSAAIRKLLARQQKEIQEILLKAHLNAHLTESELEILTLIGEGYTTSEIAAIRFRSVHTVKTQRKKVRRKLGFEYGERLATFAGREVYALKTLLSINRNAKMLYDVCQNTL